MFSQIKSLMKAMATFVTLLITRDVLKLEQVVNGISTVTFIVIIRNHNFNPGTQPIVRNITM